MEKRATPVFAVRPGIYSSIVVRRLMARLWWIFFIPVVILALMGYLFGNTWWFMIPIVIFLLYPPVLLGAYFLSVTHREAIEAQKPHRFIIDDTGIVYEEFKLVSCDDNTEENTDKEKHDTANKERLRIFDNTEIQCGITTTYTIKNEDIEGSTCENGLEIIQLKGSIGKILILPLS